MRVWTLATTFVRESVRCRLFVAALGLAAAFMVVAFLLGPLSLGTGDKIVRDVGLASLIVSSALVLFVGGTHLVGREIERKTIHLVLSRPISRPAYLVGRFVGLTLTGWISLAVATAVFVLALVVGGQSVDPSLAQAAVMTALELVVLAAIVVLFATIASPVPAMLYAMGTFIAGHTMADILSRSAENTVGISRTALDVLRWLMPDLSRFDVRLEAVHGLTVGAADVGVSLIYAVVYAAAVLCLACAAFVRREFK